MYGTKFVLIDNSELWIRRNGHDDDLYLGELTTKDTEGRVVYAAHPEYASESHTAWGFINEMYAAVYCAQMAEIEKEITQEEFEELNDSRNTIVREVSEN
jgi:hypothetical protein